MFITRKFPDPRVKERIETQTEDAEQFGHTFIEVRMRTPSLYDKRIMGLDVVKSVMSRMPGSGVAIASGAKIISDAMTVFEPDVRGIRYAYIPDTTGNRRWLAGQLRTGEYRATDINIHKEIVALAEEINVKTTEDKHKDTALDGYIKESKTKEADLLAQIAELTKKLENKSKPLSGKKANPTKVKGSK